MKTLLTFLMIALFSYGAGAMDKIDCSALKNKINNKYKVYLISEEQVKNYLKNSSVPMNVTDKNLIGLAEDSRNYSIELAFQFSTIYQAICKN